MTVSSDDPELNRRLSEARFDQPHGGWPSPELEVAYIAGWRDAFDAVFVILAES